MLVALSTLNCASLKESKVCHSDVIPPPRAAADPIVAANDDFSDVLLAVFLSVAVAACVWLEPTF